jgi:hypothetical protein
VCAQALRSGRVALSGSDRSVIAMTKRQRKEHITSEANGSNTLE